MLWKMSRFSKLHNVLRILLNNILWRLPVSLKYGMGKLLRSKRLPYKLLKPGDTVVQIGCPWDILHAGRSRGIYFSKFVEPNGKAIIIEPDQENLEKLKEFISKEKIHNIKIIEKGAWSKKEKLRFLSDPNHPAANLVEDVFDETRKDKQDFHVIEIEVDTVDNILKALHIEKIDLISITTNGAENEILIGMKEYLNKCRYLSIIGSSEQFPVLKEYDYLNIGEDDRGYTFLNKRYV